MIRAREVRVIGPDGEQFGIMDRNDAIAAAKERGYDLVLVADKVVPPVCKILDYGKYRYEAQKKKQDAKKRQSVVQIKEIKVRPKTDEHDYQTKLRHVRRFLQDGDRVKITVFFRGREIVHKDRGATILDRFVEDIKDIGKVEQDAISEDRRLQILIVPGATKQQGTSSNKASTLASSDTTASSASVNQDGISTDISENQSN